MNYAPFMRGFSPPLTNQINTYRVLLTRARYETVIFVPLGDVGDRTRTPAIYDAIADFLLACGARILEQVPALAGAAEAEKLLV